MIRFLLFLGLLYLLYVVITRPFHELFGRARRFRFEGHRGSSKKRKPPQDAEEMVACALCGTFISRREGEFRNGKFVCKPHCHAD